MLDRSDIDRARARVIWRRRRRSDRRFRAQTAVDRRCPRAPVLVSIMSMSVCARSVMISNSDASVDPHQQLWWSAVDTHADCAV